VLNFQHQERASRNVCAGVVVLQKLRGRWRAGIVGAGVATIFAGIPHVRGLGRVAPWLPLAAPACLMAAFGFARRWVGDDGFINVRVAGQLLAGRGFVFNAGERVEAVTSPAWVMLVAAGGALGFRLEDVAWGLGLAATLAGLSLASAATIDPRRHTRSLQLPLGLLCYACVPAAWDYATSGLENGLGVAFLGGSYWLVARAARGSSGWLWTSAVLGCAPLVRPDFYLLVAPLLAFALVCAAGWPERLALIGASAAPGAAYQVFRMGYFANLVPNTALAKEAFLARWEDGAHYLWNTIGLYWLFVPGAVLLLLAVARELRARSALSSGFRAAVAAGGLLHMAYVVRLGGDFMHARLLLPGVFAFFSALPLVSVERRAGWRERWLELAGCALAYAWCLVCATQLRPSATNDGDIGDERGWHARLAGASHPTRIEHYAGFPFHRYATELKQRLDASCPAATGTCRRVLITERRDGELEDEDPVAVLPLAPGATPDGVLGVVASRPLGITSAVLGLQVSLVDFYGLADALGARQTLTDRGRPGHEKGWNTYWVAATYAAKGSTTDGRVHNARSALGCGALAELRRATTEPLSWGRFWQNVLRAPSFHRLRVPASTWQAKWQFCGPAQRKGSA
jgi:arabinofuranosyltransferase